ALAASGTARADDGGAEEGDVAAPTVGASHDRTEAHVGDRLTLTVAAIAREAVAATVALPEKLDLGKFEVLDRSTADRDLGNGKRSRRFVLQVATYELGEVEIPPISVAYRTASGEARTIETRAIPVAVKKVIE